MRLPHFDYAAPTTVAEALRLLAEKGPGARVLAGGTDLLIRMRHGLVTPSAVIYLGDIAALRTIFYKSKTGLTIGAMARLVEVVAHPDIRRRYPAVADAALETANVQVRNLGTVGGNLCNAAPSADNAPTLLALGAEMVLAGPKGDRRVALDQFFKGPGQTVIAPGEILTAICVPPPPPHSGAAYQQVSARGKVDICAASVGAAVVFAGETCQEIRIFLGAVGPTPLRALETENLVRGKVFTPELIEKAGAKAAAESRPITDMRASADYRRQMVGVLTRRALLEAQKRAGKH
ncbi:MAG: xanthine dehydrogenase family protein subunit M [Deltaproteobacteria bacterium]|nr:xanthine dehydrogenase family protein subunit M [Deltaproteobacteria bacterium]